MRPRSAAFTAVFLLIAGIILIAATARIDKVIDLHPASVHMWRQSDCAAYVKAFYRNGTDLFTPGTFNMVSYKARVVSEFPLLYYIAAKIEILTGEHYWVVRGLNFFCYLLGLWALFRISRRYIHNPVLSVFPALILATAPYYYYYAVNFLPNIPAISFSFVGLYFFMKYNDHKRWTSLAWSTVFFVLATGLKPTDGGILWLAVLATWCWQQRATPGRKSKIAVIASAVIVLACIAGWVRYVNWYNDLNNNHQNLVGIYPVWDMDEGMRNYTLQRVISEWSNVYQQKYILLGLGLLLLVFIFRYRKMDKMLRGITVWLFVGAATYTILWFKAYTDHDYYQLIYVVPAVFLSITVMQYVDQLAKGRMWLQVPVCVGCAAVFVISLIHNRNIQNDRYTNPIYHGVNYAMYEAEPYLKKIGVGEHDIVVCVPDRSPNISLNAINRFGHTEEFNSNIYNVNLFKKRGASYLIVSDSSYLSKPLYQPHLKKQVGYYKGIYVFDLRD